MKHGFDLYLRPGCEYSRVRYIYRIAESIELDWLKSQKLQDFVCIDVGANIGYWSKFLIHISNVASVHAFEPDPVTYKILEKNLYGLNAIVNQAAISNLDGYLELFINPNHSGDNRPIFTDGCSAIEVPCYTLDSYCEKAQLNRVDFIKIDIQGGEIYALEGALNLIEKFKPMLLVEIATELDTGRESINIYIAEFAEKYGYAVWMIKNGLSIKLSKKEIHEFRGNVFLKAI
jgi:FkbM family methyltransferase